VSWYECVEETEDPEFARDRAMEHISKKGIHGIGATNASKALKSVFIAVQMVSQ